MKTLVFLLVIIASSAGAQLQTKRVSVPAKFAARFDSTHEVRINGEYKIGLYYIDTAVVKRPRFMAMGPFGIVYVADLKSHNIWAIPDFDSDGAGDSAYIASPPVDSAHSLYIWNDTMYVAEPSRVRKFIDSDHDFVFETEAPFITGIHSTGPYNHYTRTVLLDTINRQLYLSVGASCNACREEHYQRATILQYSINGFISRTYATGLRNAMGLALDPDSNRLWATNADRDGLGDDVPPEIVMPVAEDGFYGWPLAYGNKVWVDFKASPEYQALLPITSVDSQRVDRMQVAPIMVEAHSTPMGIVFYHDPRVYIQPPPKTIFVVRHGSAKGGRTIGLGYDVLRFQWNKADSLWERSTFLEGFLTDSINYSYWGRPCGIIQDTSGQFIYLSSDVGMPALYRITLNDVSRVEKNIEPLAPVVFPNPAERSFSVTINREAVVKIYSLLGKEVPATIERSPAGYQVSLPKATPGLYFCRVATSAASYTLAVIIE